MSHWSDDGACREYDPELWFPHPGDRVTATHAKAICKGCPVLETCLAEALARPSTVGVWGATTDKDRELMRRRNRAKSRRANA